MSVPAEHIEDTSPSISDKRTCSNVAATGSVTIDQMVRDFIIAKTIGMNGNGRVGDSVKVEQGCKERHKSDKKKKKKKHKSHHKDGSSKCHRHRHRDRRSRDTSSDSSLNDDGCTNVEDVVEDKNAAGSHCIKNADSQRKDDPLTITRTVGICTETSQTSQGFVSAEMKEASLNFDAGSKCHSDGQTVTLSEKQTSKTSDKHCHCSNPLEPDDSKNETVSSLDKCDTSAKLIVNTSNECHTKDDHVQNISLLSERFCVSEADKVNISADAEHSAEAASHSRKENILLHEHSDETRKLTSQDHRHELGVSSKNRHYIDNDKISYGSKKQHSRREHRSTVDGSRCDKASSSRKRSPSFEAVMDKHCKVTEDGRSDDVVFIKTVSAHDMVKSCYSREAGSNNEKSSHNREQKSSQGNNRSIATDSSDKHGGSKRRYDRDDDSVPQCKSTKERRHTKESSVILLSDDEADVLSEEMAEKLHKRLTTSIKKSKRLQAEKQLNLADNLTTCEPSAGHGTELIEEPMCHDAANTQNDVSYTSAYSEIIVPADSGMPCAESSTSEVEQTAGNSTGLGLFGKKTLKFGLKISESSAALISKGVKRLSQASGNKACGLLPSYVEVALNI